MWNLKKWYKWTYLQHKSRLTDRKQTHGYYGESGESGESDKLGLWVYRYTLLHIK